MTEEKCTKKSHVWDFIDVNPINTIITLRSCETLTTRNESKLPYTYKCRNCNITKIFNEKLPCLHLWKEVSHNYGSQYEKRQCDICGISSIIVYEIGDSDSD